MGKKQRSLIVTCGMCESRDRVGFSVAKAAHRRILKVGWNCILKGRAL